mmetsp:Transcript_6219/g.15857  ORF Transcript_6219/g.15857 Transcript_6219/m.15857 type:complete len:647 (-) Transcript_6219:1138-3078(-)
MHQCHSPLSPPQGPVLSRPSPCLSHHICIQKAILNIRYHRVVVRLFYHLITCACIPSSSRIFIFSNLVSNLYVFRRPKIERRSSAPAALSFHLRGDGVLVGGDGDVGGGVGGGGGGGLLVRRSDYYHGRRRRVHAPHDVGERLEHGLHRRLVDLVVRDQPHLVGLPGDDHDVALAQLGQHARDVDLLGEVEEADVALHGAPHLEAVDLAQPRGQLRHAQVVQVDHRVDLLERHERRRRQHACLPHGAAARLAQPPRPADELGVAQDDAAHGGAQALGEAHAHGVRRRHAARGGDAQRRRGVPYPRAVQVQLDAVLLAQLPALVEVLQGQHASAALVVGLFHAQQARGGEVLIVRTDHAADVVQVYRAVVLVGHGARVRAHQGRRTALLVDVDVAQGSADELAATHLAVHAHADEVTHGARGHEHGGLLVEDGAHLRLQQLHRGVVSKHVVAHRRLRHRPPHGVRGLGHGVGPQVDDEGLLGAVRAGTLGHATAVSGDGTTTGGDGGGDDGSGGGASGPPAEAAAHEVVGGDGARGGRGVAREARQGRDDGDAACGTHPLLCAGRGHASSSAGRASSGPAALAAAVLAAAGAGGGQRVLAMHGHVLSLGGGQLAQQLLVLLVDVVGDGPLPRAPVVPEDARLLAAAQ